MGGNTERDILGGLKVAVGEVIRGSLYSTLETNERWMLCKSADTVVRDKTLTGFIYAAFSLSSIYLGYIILLLLLLKEVGNARLRESDLHSNGPKTPAPQYQPLDRKKRKG